MVLSFPMTLSLIYYYVNKMGFLDLDIRRDFFMKDAIREGKKPKFVANKLIKVSCTCTCNPNYIFYMHVG